MDQDLQPRQPDLTDKELQQRRRAISRGLRRLNTSAIAILLVVLALAIAAILATQRSERLRARAEAAETDAQRKLYVTQLSQARAERLTGKMGRRRRSLDAIAAAVELRPSLPVTDPIPLRNEAIASLALADVELTNTLRQLTSAETTFDFSPSLEMYAAGHTNGEVTLYRFNDGKLVLQWKGPAQAGAVSNVKFSSDGQRLAISYEHGDLFLARPETNMLPRLVAAAEVRNSRSSLHFSADGRWLGVLSSDGRARIFNSDIFSAHVIELPEVSALAFHPQTNCVALSSRMGIRFLDFDGRQIFRPLTNAPLADEIVFRPDGKQLAAAGQYSGMALWNLRTGEPTRLPAPSGGFYNLLYDPRGSTITAALGDGVSRIWSAYTGELLHIVEGGRVTQFGQDGQTFAFERPREGITLGRLIRSPALRSFHWQADEEYFRRFWCVDFSGDGRWLAAVDNAYLVVWDALSEELVAKFRSTPRQMTVSWLSGDEAWLTTSSRRISTYPMSPNPRPILGQPRQIEISEVVNPLGQATLAPDGHTIAIVTNTGVALLIDLNHSEKRTPLPYDGPGALGHLAFSPDGRWIASSATEQFAILVWEVHSGKLTHRVPGAHGRIAYSPNGRLLVLGTAHEYSFWDTTTWQMDPARSIRRDNLADTTGAVAFSPDGTLLAVAGTRQLVQVVDPQNGRELASLQAPDPQTISWLRFNADGSQLAAAGFDGVVHVWNLGWLQQQLADWGLGWAKTKEVARPIASKGPPSTSLFLPIIAVFLVLVFVAFAFRRQRQLFDAYVQVDRLAVERARELQSAKAEIIHSQKMKALGTLAAGIAHDFNNLLSVIRMSNKLIGRAAPQTGEIQENVTEIEQAVQQGKHVVRSMLGYSRAEADAMGLFNLTEVVEDTVALLSKEFLSGIRLTLELAPDIPKIKASRGRLEQILLNLVVNAAEAMEGNGSLRLTVRALAQPRQVFVLRAHPAERYVELAVTDSGPGIKPEIMERIFEPFFTTKGTHTSPGTGLGLSMVYSIAEQDGLGISMETSLGRGTTFRIAVPAE